MRRVVAVCNQKGGVGKTSTAINLGGALADMGMRVLFIDLDPQGNLTEALGFKELYAEPGTSLYGFLVGKQKTGVAELIHKHPIEPFSIVTSNYEMFLAEQALYMTRNREHKLKELMPQLNGEFDWVLIDCPPFLGNLTDNALNAARQVVIPIEAEPASVRSLELLFDQIESVERGLSIEIPVLAVVPNKVQDSALGKKILADLRRSIPVVTPFEIRKRVMLQAAWNDGHSIFAHEVRSAADEQTKREIMDSYRELARFVRDKVEGNHG